MKGLGAGLVLLGTAGFGWHMAGLWKQRLELLLSLRQLVYFLKGEILYSHATLAEGLSHAGKKGGGPFGDLFEEAAGRLNLRDGAVFPRYGKKKGRSGWIFLLQKKTGNSSLHWEITWGIWI